MKVVKTFEVIDGFEPLAKLGKVFRVSVSDELDTCAVWQVIALRFGVNTKMFTSFTERYGLTKTCSMTGSGVPNCCLYI